MSLLDTPRTRDEVAKRIWAWRRTARFMMEEARRVAEPGTGHGVPSNVEEWICLNHARNANESIECLRAIGRRMPRVH